MKYPLLQIGLVFAIAILPFNKIAFAPRPVQAQSIEKAEPEYMPTIELTIEEPQTFQEYAEQQVTRFFGRGQWGSFKDLINKESSWNPNAVNPSSGACGIGQALPCEKMGLEDWTDPFDQVDWTIRYVRDRYRTPHAALQFWLDRQAECYAEHPERLLTGEYCGGWY